MSSDLVKEGFSQGGILPTAFVAYITADAILPIVTAAGDDWMDPAQVIDITGTRGTQSVHNSSPAKLTENAGENGIDILVPGLYECDVTMEFYNVDAAVVGEVAFAVIENTATDPRVFYTMDDKGITAAKIPVLKSRTVTRKFFIDVDAPMDIILVACSRVTSGDIQLYGGQLSVRRISKYSAVVRSGDQTVVWP